MANKQLCLLAASWLLLTTSALSHYPVRIRGTGTRSGGYGRNQEEQTSQETCIQTFTSASCHLHRFSQFRSIDGTCNNLLYPTAGARNTPLLRLLRADYVDGFDIPRGFPGTKPIVASANTVSEELFKVEKENKGTGALSVMFMTMGQFLDHDMGLATHPSCSVTNCKSPDAFKLPCFPILFENGSSECTGFGRANPVCQQHIKRNKRQPRNQVNELTAFIDGSQIYGSSLTLSQRLRRNDGTGMLKILNDLLPIDEKMQQSCRVLGGCSLVGESRGDENIALHSMHTLWVREHNKIVKQLKIINPHWNEELLYQSTRKIVGGMLQHIIFTEWLPNVVRLPRYRGYNINIYPSVANAFSAAAFRFGHSLIPNSFSQLNKNFDPLHKPVTLQESLRNRGIINERGIEPVMFGLAGNKSNNVDNGFAFGIVRKLFIRPGQSGRMDLTAFNIQRGRDHGIPTYGKWRQRCGLPVVRSFNELKRFMLPGTVEAFQKLYSSPDHIDLFAAGISEIHVPGLQVGPTFECIFRNQFSRLRDGDRFFYQAKGVFNSQQLREIEKATLARVLCDNLKGIVSIQPSVFKVDTAYKNRRVGCSRISEVDLTAWKDTTYSYNTYRSNKGDNLKEKNYQLYKYNGDDLKTRNNQLSKYNNYKKNTMKLKWKLQKRKRRISKIVRRGMQMRKFG